MCITIRPIKVVLRNCSILLAGPDIKNSSVACVIIAIKFDYSVDLILGCGCDLKLFPCLPAEAMQLQNQLWV